jgi:pimeloyl-ACP methyl ester carboxylesterase
MRIFKWIKVAALGLAGLATVAVLSGATLEHLARAHTVQSFKAPGRLVDVGGGRRLQIDCRGAGSPTVVLESGLDFYGSLAWAAVHDSIARSTRVCAYSRAGVMWSDPAPRGAFDSRNTARDLHAALLAAGESAPWIMVGHSLGGPYVMTFTATYGGEVAGVVFVDATHPGQFAQMDKAAGKPMRPSATVPKVGAALAWTGLVRALPSAPGPRSWPAMVSDAGNAFLPTSLNALAQEMDAIPATLARAGELRTLGDRPLIVLAAGRVMDADEMQANGVNIEQAQRLAVVHRAIQADEATWSTRGHLEVIEDASHYIQFDRPSAVIHAVRDVLAATRLAGANMSPRR